MMESFVQKGDYLLDKVVTLFFFSMEWERYSKADFLIGGSFQSFLIYILAISEKLSYLSLSLIEYKIWGM